MSVTKSRSLLRCITLLDVGTGAWYCVKCCDIKHSGSLSIDGQPVTLLIKEDIGGKEQSEMVSIRRRKFLATVFTTTDGTTNVSTSLCIVIDIIFSSF